MTEQDVSVGILLKQAREKSGRQQQDATREVNLSRSQLAALESDSFDALPGEAFVRGYIRIYAKWLGLDVDAVIAQYLAQTGQNAELKPVTKKVASTAAPLEDTGRMLTAAVVVAVVILGAWLYNDMTADRVQRAAPVGQVDELQVDSIVPQRDVDTAVEAAASVVAVAENNAPASQVDARELEKIPAQVDAVERVVSEPLEDANGTTVDSADTGVAGLSIQQIEQEAIQEQQQVDEALLAEAVATDQLDTAEDTSAVKDTLTLTFTADCWIEVSDASQQLSYSGLGKAGRVRQFQGVAPFKVLLGFARGATVQLNGDAFEFTPRSNRNSVRLTVGND